MICQRLGTVSCAALTLATALILTPWSEPARALEGETSLSGPFDSFTTCFGAGVYPLPNGQVVVTDPCYAFDRGAAYLYANPLVKPVHPSFTVYPVASLYGSEAGDRVGADVVVLATGNYVVSSPGWRNGTGAVTWADGDIGVSGTVSAANSLVGAQPSDGIGAQVVPLSNGNYVVASTGWGNGAGAVTWGDGESGSTGVVSGLNSLVGSQPGDEVGAGVTGLSNGNVVVASPRWDNGSTLNAGAVTWLSGATATGGVVSATNSIVGTQADDQIGELPVTALASGNYVVASPRWDSGGVANAGAVTWGNGSVGTVGAVSASNSLVGDQAGDQVGFGMLQPVALSNGHYVVVSQLWDNGASADVGAVTWGNGAHGTAGAVSTANSLVGSQAGEMLGRVTSLTNGNYVVANPSWGSGRGSVTWVNGSTGLAGVVPLAGSLVGSQPGDLVGYGPVTALANGNYVVASPYWNWGSIANAGAVTWGNGATGVSGVVSTANSLHGAQPDDQIGGSQVTALANGHYVVGSFVWDNGAVVDAGAVTWGDGTGGTVGAVGPTNSLIGSAGDWVGGVPVTALTNGNYVVATPLWANGRGAVTWGDGATGTIGVVSAANSLVGAQSGDQLGLPEMMALPTGDAVVWSGEVDNGAVVDAGAVTPFAGDGPSTGVVGPENSLLGDATDSIGEVVFEPVRRLILIGRPTQNRVSIITPPSYSALEPTRLLDTRTSDIADTADGMHVGTGPVVGGTVYQLSVAGRGGVATDADSVALNVTVTAPQAPGFVTVFPCGSARPTASSLNYEAAQTVANAVVSKLGVAGMVCLYTLATTDLIVDVNGFYAPGSGYVAVNPARLLETRSGEAVGTIDDQFTGAGQLAGGATIELQVGGRAGVPLAATAAVLNVTVTQPSAPGFITVYPCGSPRPTASNLNYTAGQTVPNSVVAKLGTEGRVCLYSLAATHLIVDVNGFHTAKSTYVALNPVRLLETRAGQAEGTIDGAFEGIGVVAGGGWVELQISGRGGVLPTATAAVLNVTVTEPSAPGFITVYPCGTFRPNASSLNYGPGQTVPNPVVARIGPLGKVCLFTLATTHLIVDVNGYVP